MGKLTSDYIERLDLKDRFVFRVGGMKVGRVVLPPKHLDGDSEKAADGRHQESVRTYTLRVESLFLRPPRSHGRGMRYNGAASKDPSFFIP
jgi:hypothetical protein